LKDKSCYDGDVNDEGEMSGDGLLLFPNGDFKRGVFHRNLFFYGRVQLTNARGQVEKLVYHGRRTGTFKGKWSAYANTFSGTLQNENGSERKGDWVQHDFSIRLHGRGEATRADGSLEYRGNYRDGLMHGSGEFHFTDGRTYNGEFAYGHFQGLGVIEHEEDDGREEGEFKNGDLVRGTRVYANGDVYEGEFGSAAREWANPGGVGPRQRLGTFTEKKTGARYEGSIPLPYFPGLRRALRAHEGVGWRALSDVCFSPHARHGIYSIYATHNSSSSCAVRRLSV
jgi:hypothetical protein